METKRVSKLLSLVLRHKPEAHDLTMDRHGWVEISQIIKNIKGVTRELIDEAVATNNKKRFEVEGNRIRAVQGHSVDVDVGLEEKIPPEYLFHGTATRFIKSIMEQGIVSKTRLHVHLSDNLETAIKVGKRHGKVAVIKLYTPNLLRKGYKFYQAKNGVWLTDKVNSNDFDEIVYV